MGHKKISILSSNIYLALSYLMAALTDIKWMTSEDMSLRHEALSQILPPEEATDAAISPTTGGVRPSFHYHKRHSVT